MNLECSQNRRLVGARISELRRAQGLSQRKLAQMISMDHAYISKLEAGKENPSLDTLTRISTGLDVHIAQLFVFRSRKDYAFVGGI